MNNTDFMRRRLLDRAGVFSGVKDSLESLRRSEWSARFELLMRNRLVMGAFRYGKLGGQDKPQYDRISAIRQHMDAYSRDGNLEHLVDIANLALCEFVEGDHPRRHFDSVDDGKHAEALDH